MQDKKKIPTPEAKQPINSPQMGRDELWDVDFTPTGKDKGELYFHFGPNVIGPIIAPYFKKGTPGKPDPFAARDVKGSGRTERNAGSKGK